MNKRPVLPNFFIKNNQIKDNRVEITGELLRHLRDSLRVKIGEEIVFVDEDRNRYIAVVTHAGKDWITGNIIEKTGHIKEQEIYINLVQAVPKGPKFDFIIQKATELGAGTITPVISERCVVRFDEGQAQAKLMRWKKIALEAAQQSNRRDVPEIEYPVRLSEFLSSYEKGDLNIMLWEGEKGEGERGEGEKGEGEKGEGHGIKDMLKSAREVKSVVVIIGPEGGFSEDEIKMAAEKGFTSVSLGKSILRTETAPIVILSIILYESGCMG